MATLGNHRFTVKVCDHASPDIEDVVLCIFSAYLCEKCVKKKPVDVHQQTSTYLWQTFPTSLSTSHSFTFHATAKRNGELEGEQRKRVLLLSPERFIWEGKQLGFFFLILKLLFFEQLHKLVSQTDNLKEDALRAKKHSRETPEVCC